MGLTVREMIIELAQYEMDSEIKIETEDAAEAAAIDSVFKPGRGSTGTIFLVPDRDLQEAPIEFVPV